MQATHINLINQAVSHAFGNVAWSQNITITRGLSSASLYKLVIDGRDYVVKIDDPEHPHNDLIREYHAISIAAKHHIAPQVHYNDPQQGIILMDYIENVALPRDNLQQPEMIEKFANLVRHLHAGDDFKQAESIFQRVDMIHELLSTDWKNLAFIKQTLTIKTTLQDYLSDPDDQRPCHGDMNPYNLLFDGQSFCLVDWSAAAQENFYFDLASCAIFFYHGNDMAIAKFLQIYFSRTLSQQELDKFYLMQVFVALYYGIMFIYASTQQQNTPLSVQTIADLPSYATFMQSIGKGEVNLADSMAQQQLGWIYIQMALTQQQYATLSDTITRLQK